MGLKSTVRCPVAVLLLSRSETLAEALDEVRGCASTVNEAVVQLKFASLSGETCCTCASETESVAVSNGAGEGKQGRGRRGRYVHL